MAFKEYANSAETRVVLMVNEAEQAALHALAVVSAGEIDLSNIEGGTAKAVKAVEAKVAEIEASAGRAFEHYTQAFEAKIEALRAEIAKAAAAPPAL